MEKLREKLLEVIANALPETPEVREFCEDMKFTKMLDGVMDAIRYHLESAFDDILGD